MQGQYITATHEGPHSLVTPVCRGNSDSWCKHSQKEVTLTGTIMPWPHTSCRGRACRQDTGQCCDHPTSPPPSLMAELLRKCCHSSKKLPQTHWSQKAVNSQRAPGPFEAYVMHTKIRPCKLCMEAKHQILDFGAHSEQIQNFMVAKAILNLFLSIHLCSGDPYPPS